MTLLPGGESIKRPKEMSKFNAKTKNAKRLKKLDLKQLIKYHNE